MSFDNGVWNCLVGLNVVTEVFLILKGDVQWSQNKFLNPISLQPEDVKLWYFKLELFDFLWSFAK